MIHVTCAHCGHLILTEKDKKTDGQYGYAQNYHADCWEKLKQMYQRPSNWPQRTTN